MKLKKAQDIKINLTFHLILSIERLQWTLKLSHLETLEEVSEVQSEIIGIHKRCKNCKVQVLRELAVEELFLGVEDLKYNQSH